MKNSTAAERWVSPGDSPAFYEIKLEGTLEAHWSEWLGEMEIRVCPDGQTVLAGWLADQSALYGIIARLRDLNLVLVSVNRIDR